jgi:hypothetical protein
MLNAKNSPTAGAVKYGSLFDRVGGKICFVKSFIASAIGCKIPKIETLLGPFRRWEYPRIFRSSKVKKAMDKRIKIIVERGVMRLLTKTIIKRKVSYLVLNTNAIICHFNYQ